VEEFETEKIKKSRRDGGENKGERKEEIAMS